MSKADTNPPTGKDKDKGKDDDPEVATGAMASVPDAVMRPGVAADAIVAAPDEAFPWWRHPCPPEILSQGEGSRAYWTWWMKRYRAKRRAEFIFCGIPRQSTGI